MTRTFDAPPGIVWDAWTKPELFKLWWAPKSSGGGPPLSCEMDVRTGGSYRIARPRRLERYGLLRHVPRGVAALAPRLDQ